MRFTLRQGVFHLLGRYSKYLILLHFRHFMAPGTPVVYCHVYRHKFKHLGGLYVQQGALHGA